jgi:hypothetical protein
MGFMNQLLYIKKVGILYYLLVLKSNFLKMPSILTISPVALTRQFVDKNGYPVCMLDTLTSALYTRRGRVPVRVYSCKGNNARTTLTFAWEDKRTVVSVKM